MTRIDYERERLAALLPQNPPFLFLDTAFVEEDRAGGSYRISGEEARGHFAENPVFPASLMIEALGQLACVWLLSSFPGKQVYFVGLERVRSRRICRPGEVLRMTIQSRKVRAPLAYFDGKIAVGEEVAASCESLTLAFPENSPETISLFR